MSNDMYANFFSNELKNKNKSYLENLRYLNCSNRMIDKLQKRIRTVGENYHYHNHLLSYRMYVARI